MGPAGEVAHLATLLVPAAVGRRRSVVGPLSGSHLLDPAGGPLVRLEGEGDPVRRADGLAALGDDCNGRRSQADAENLWHGWTKSGSEGISSVLVGAVARQLASYRFRSKTGFRFRLALADSGRNDFPESWFRSTTDDGPRP